MLDFLQEEAISPKNQVFPGDIANDYVRQSTCLGSSGTHEMITDPLISVLTWPGDPTSNRIFCTGRWGKWETCTQKIYLA